jgi:hypothetical protein
MPFNPADFAADTEFERSVLDCLAILNIRVPEPKYIYSDKKGIIGKIGMAEEGTGPREELRVCVRPLLFVASYKVLDMLVEHVLKANTAPSGRLTFEWKRRNVASRPGMLPTPLNNYLTLWDCLVKLYEVFADARNAVTHRRFKVTGAGALEVYDDSRNLVGMITSVENQSFSAGIHATAELVINGQSDRRRTNIAGFYLNTLQQRHGQPLLPATDPNAHRWRLEIGLAEVGDGRLRFDLASAREIIDRQPKPSLWDLRLNGGGRVFVGFWEEVPDDLASAVDFDPTMPPAWLSPEAIG